MYDDIYFITWNVRQKRHLAVIAYSTWQSEYLSPSSIEEPTVTENMWTEKDFPLNSIASVCFVFSRVL